MWCRAVKFGGDSGAVQQVSDIGGGFGRVPFTARSRGCHAIDGKREIISTPLRPSKGGPAPAPRAPRIWWLKSPARRALRAVGTRVRGVHRAVAGSYISTRSRLLLGLERKAGPPRPPIT